MTCLTQEQQFLADNFDAAVNLMDDDIREATHSDMAPCSERSFILEYCVRHQEKYQEEFSIS